MQPDFLAAEARKSGSAVFFIHSLRSIRLLARLPTTWVVACWTWIEARAGEERTRAAPEIGHHIGEEPVKDCGDAVAAHRSGLKRSRCQGVCRKKVAADFLARGLQGNRSLKPDHT